MFLTKEMIQNKEFPPDFRTDFRPNDGCPMQQYLLYYKEDRLNQGGKMPKRRLPEDTKQALAISTLYFHFSAQNSTIPENSVNATFC